MSVRLGDHTYLCIWVGPNDILKRELEGRRGVEECG